MTLQAHCMAKVGNKVYVTGGWTEGTRKLTNVYIYDFSQFPTTVTGPEIGPSLNLGRDFHACGTLANGAIIVAGGDSTEGRTNKVEILLPGSTSWVTRKCYSMLMSSHFDFEFMAFSSKNSKSSCL